MPLDPQIFRDLDADRIREEPLPPLLDRLVYMGILLAPCQQMYSTKFPKVIQQSYQRFARSLNYRPWNTVLIRKQMARDQRLRQLETLLLMERWMGAPAATAPVLTSRLRWLEEAALEIHVWQGWDVRTEPAAAARTAHTPRRGTPHRS